MGMQLSMVRVSACELYGLPTKAVLIRIHNAALISQSQSLTASNGTARREMYVEVSR